MLSALTSSVVRPTARATRSTICSATTMPCSGGGATASDVQPALGERNRRAPARASATHAWTHSQPASRQASCSPARLRAAVAAERGVRGLIGAADVAPRTHRGDAVHAVGVHEGAVHHAGAAWTRAGGGWAEGREGSKLDARAGRAVSCRAGQPAKPSQPAVAVSRGAQGARGAHLRSSELPALEYRLRSSANRRPSLVNPTCGRRSGGGGLSRWGGGQQGGRSTSLGGLWAAAGGRGRHGREQQQPHERAQRAQRAQRALRTL